jgi:hypothetical protein
MDVDPVVSDADAMFIGFAIDSTGLDSGPS